MFKGNSAQGKKILEGNVLELKWRNVDLIRQHAFVSASQSKTRTAIPVPLNDKAISYPKTDG